MSGDDSGQVPGDDLPPGVQGADLARAMLEAAKVKRASAPRRTGAAGRTGVGKGRRARGYSGPGPDPRDPQPLAKLLSKLVRDRGWQQPTAEARVFATWPQVVGAEIADHCRPTKLENGELTVEAESTAWATQLRLLARQVLTSIGRAVGPNVVKRLHIHGPAAPSWRHGPRRVRGRGPRDTYG